MFCTAAPARVSSKTPIDCKMERIRQMSRSSENPINSLSSLPALLCQRFLFASRSSLCYISGPGRPDLSTNPTVCAAGSQKDPMRYRHLMSLFHPLIYSALPSFPDFSWACLAPTTMQESMSWQSHGRAMALTHMGTHSCNTLFSSVLKVQGSHSGTTCSAAQSVAGKGDAVSMWETQRKYVRKPQNPKADTAQKIRTLRPPGSVPDTLSSGWALIALTHCCRPSKSPTHSD